MFLLLPLFSVPSFPFSLFLFSTHSLSLSLCLSRSLSLSLSSSLSASLCLLYFYSPPHLSFFSPLFMPLYFPRPLSFPLSPCRSLCSISLCLFPPLFSLARYVLSLSLSLSPYFCMYRIIYTHSLLPSYRVAASGMMRCYQLAAVCLLLGVLGER